MLLQCPAWRSNLTLASVTLLGNRARSRLTRHIEKPTGREQPSAAPLPGIRHTGNLPLTMADIVLTTLNAKYIHAAFGLRYLLANLGPLQAGAAIVEFDINQRPVDIVEALLARQPKIIGLGVYIWNVAPATEVVATLKRVRPGHHGNPGRPGGQLRDRVAGHRAVG